MSDLPSLAPLRSLGDLTSAELAVWCEAHGQRAFRAAQIRRWIFGKRVESFEAMHDVPAALRMALAHDFDLFGSTVVRHLKSADGTEKLLVQLRDRERVECVLMREESRRTVCVSTQVGCGMGCVFCASGLLGVKRNLTVGEIVEQILHVDRLLPREERVTNIVVMGMGEPLANLRNLLPALATLNETGGLGIGARRITISTVGLPEKIHELARQRIPYNLAVSLHAPDDELRTQIVPINEKIGIEAILSAADEYFECTGRRVTYEYCLLAGTNDAPEQARELARLLGRRIAHVNVIPMNPVAAVAWERPAAPRTRLFVETLEREGIKVTVRKRKGADIDAACGQLRLTDLQDAEAEPLAESGVAT